MPAIRKVDKGLFVVHTVRPKRGGWKDLEETTRDFEVKPVGYDDSVEYGIVHIGDIIFPKTEVGKKYSFRVVEVKKEALEAKR